MARGIIYLILNKQNGEKFVGNTTIGMNKEWVYHIERSKRMSTEPLHKAFRDHGVHNFMIKELDECDETEFENKTTYWIQQYKPEYNPIVIEPIEIKEVVEEIKVQRTYRSSPHLIPWNDEIRGNGKHFGLKIRSKNLSTGICTDYESARVASEQVTGNPINNSNILLAARTGRTAYGHKWQLLETKFKKKAVFSVNKRTQQIEIRYESIAAAVRAYECTDKHGILKSLKNPGKVSWKGQYWYYVN
jgi:group I intron endonuclease